MKSWKLICVKTGAEVTIGEKRSTSRGNLVTITGFRPPHRISDPFTGFQSPCCAGSTGKVDVEFVDGVPGEFYPSLIDARYVEVDDAATPDADKISRLLGDYFRPKGAQ